MHNFQKIYDSVIYSTATYTKSIASSDNPSKLYTRFRRPLNELKYNIGTFYIK